MLGGIDDRHWQYLGAPPQPTGYQHGQAGRLEDGCRVDCWLKLDGERLEAVSFEVFGSAEALQMAGWLADWLQNADRRSAASVTGRWIAAQTAASPEARSEALVIEDALHAAITSAESTQGGG